MTRKLSEQELRLWQRVAQTVKPFRPASTPEAELQPPLVTPHSVGADTTNASIPTRIERGAYPLQDHSGHRRVRRGRLPIDASLDLHGHSEISARHELLDFVNTQRRAGARRLLVITGKGRAGGGLLRRRFTDWINQADFRPHLSGYAPASPRHGGEGAFYLLLKRRDDR